MLGDNLKEERFIVFTASGGVQTFGIVTQCCYLQSSQIREAQLSLIFFKWVFECVCFMCSIWACMCVQSPEEYPFETRSLTGPRAKQGASHTKPPVSAPYSTVVTDTGVAMSSFFTLVLGSQTHALRFVQQVLLLTEPVLQLILIFWVTVWFWDWLHSYLFPRGMWPEVWIHLLG